MTTHAPPLIALCFALASATAAAQSNYPNRPIRIIAQFQPGTSTDILARVVAQKLEHSV